MARITRLLVANRGEIARRIFRTAHEMGIETVAVYADPDAGEPFVREASVAVALAGNTSAETYLDIAKSLDAARRTGADAIHPGYGFLSENAAFARAVIAAGMTWVGPHPEAIAAMGDKLEAKKIAREAGVPTLESIELSASTTAEELGAAAESIGYPVLVKAAGGGGGRGMRVVREPGQLANAVASARREAKSAFGNDTVFLEKYLARSRHIEVQLFGDKHGNLVHLFERECSIQRRHQKVVEEAPSPAVSPALREQLGAAAIAAGSALRYDNAGTVEFLLDASDGATGEFYFLEVNTRLQVEHPVTEAITGLDLVREQIRVAEGEPLSFAQQDLSTTGHAIEVRLYAEDPEKEFLPAAGRVLAFRRPASPALRWDSGVEDGSDVSVYFDPMLAKLIAHGPTRREAAMSLALGLQRLRLPGLVTNRDFLVNTLRHEAFLAGDTTTDFIERVAPARGRQATETQLRTATVAAALAARRARLDGAAVLRTVPAGWRNNRGAGQRFSGVFAQQGSVQLDADYHEAGGGLFRFCIGGEDAEVHVYGDASGEIAVAIGGLRRTVHVLHHDGRWHTHDGEIELTVTELSRFPDRDDADGSGGYEAPMPGKVTAVHVSTGDAVKAGQLLLILEAMKMEHHITTLKAGTVSEVRVTPGEQVAGGTVMVVIE